MNLKLFTKENIFQEMDKTFQVIYKEYEGDNVNLESKYSFLSRGILDDTDFIHNGNLFEIIHKILDTFFKCRKYEYYDKIDFFAQKMIYYENQIIINNKKWLMYEYFNIQINDFQSGLFGFDKTDIALFYTDEIQREYKKEKEQYKVVKNSLNKVLNKDIMYIVNSFLFKNIRVSYNNKVYQYTCRCGTKLCFNSRKLHKKSKKHIEFKKRK
tara:strand:- start:312 stop:947 length:636 start_codon:yes stop_codon:yes gene_type:complete